MDRQCPSCGGFCKKSGCERADYVPPEQEPVAYLDEGLGAFYFAKQYKKNVGFTPLYTTPPQRTWVGLTEVEVNEVLGGDIRDEPSGLLEFVRAIEAKLKEKNT